MGNEVQNQASKPVEKKSTAMLLANIAGFFAFMGVLFFGPLCLLSLILGIIAFLVRTEDEKQSGWGGKTVNNRALTAILATPILIIFSIFIKWLVSTYCE